jgi:hypothetical protein
MSDQGSLIVPVQVQAMMLNCADMNFIRAGMDYALLGEYGSPSPTPFEEPVEDFAGQSGNQGVYLMWTLPEALRRGSRRASGELEFPLVPNRWLVVRLYWEADASPPGASSPQVQTCVVQSDLLNSPNTSSAQYLDPTATTPTPTLLGQQVPVSLEQPWQEPGSGGVPYFLRAVAESNLSFAAYQPFNQNVFSIFDDLVTQGVGAGTLSYFVLGWYSEAAADILAGWKPGPKSDGFDELLARLRWLATGPNGTAQSSLYEGMVFGVPWEPNASSPPPSPATTANPQVAVGNTSVDALTAFVEAALEAAQPPQSPPLDMTPGQAAELLEAFQYNLLQMLSAPGSQELLEQTISSQWFGSAAAGRRWVITDAPQNDDASPPASPPLTLTAAEQEAELAAEAEWLPELNAAQAEFDWKQRELMGVRRRVFELWWKQGAANYVAATPPFQYPWNTTPEQFAQALDPTDPDGLLAEARRLLRSLDHLAAQIPTATARTPLDQAILEFAQAKGLPAWRVLKAVAQPRFWQAADPVLLISGTGSALNIDPNATLQCRWIDEIVSALDVNAGPGGPAFTIDAQQLAPYLPAVPWANLPAEGPSLFQEFFLLDPTNAPILAAAAGYDQLADAQVSALAASMNPPQVVSESPPSPPSASPPAEAQMPPAILAPYPWAQPWQPLFLDWEIAWNQLTFPNWSFNGLDYDLTPGAPPAAYQPMLSGRSLLTPKPSFDFKARLEQFINETTGSPAARQLQTLEGLIQTVDQWDFLSQTLSGLTTQLSGWSPVPLQNPDATVPVFGGSPPDALTWAALIGNAAQATPLAPALPNLETPPPGFPSAPPRCLKGCGAGSFTSTG